jgi:pyruvate kinase
MIDKKAKIVATLGPASAQYDTMLKMVKEGVNVFRINFSHGDHETHRNTMRIVKKINDDHDLTIATLADLQGPKLRVGVVEEGAVVNPGDRVEFTNEECEGTAQRVFMTYEHFARDVEAGERILLDDGKLIMKVVSTDKKSTVVAEVVQGGPLKSKKGVNLPNTKISLPCLTPKDIADLDVALEEGAEWIGLSFVRSADDVRELKERIANSGHLAHVISKIEKPEAVRDIDSILEATDGVMVARGDLGVEVPMQSVPLVQKMIVRKAHEKSVPVIIATQMMETMIDSMTPTRAEVNDVANSVLDGADAMMLSGETSVGQFPVEVIKAMAKIIVHTEESSNIEASGDHTPVDRNERFITDSICYNAAKIADQIAAKAILTLTFSGYTAFKISAHRPKTNILVFTANRAILNTLSLIWGVQGFYYDSLVSTDNTFKDLSEIIKSKGLASTGDSVIKIASMPITEQGMTNTLKIETLH